MAKIIAQFDHLLELLAQTSLPRKMNGPNWVPDQEEVRVSFV